MSNSIYISPVSLSKIQNPHESSIKSIDAQHLVVRASPTTTGLPIPYLGKIIENIMSNLEHLQEILKILLPILILGKRKKHASNRYVSRVPKLPHA
jgi:hypothetical protein